MHSNRYIIIYASVLVIIVATVLATAAIQLKPFQDKNIRLEKMQNILTSVKIEASPADAESKFETYIAEEIVIDSKGEVIGNNAFDIELVNELKKAPEQRQYPLFVYKSDDGSSRYIIPVRGKGLWGPIWGYIALNEDLSTVYGAVFDHKSETPGLGAEINQVSFQSQFVGKSIFDESGAFTSILVKKGGAESTDKHAVDAISGGTITSDGVTHMLKDCLNNYVAFIEKQRRAQS
jgi:Na+-transporting NADH:ubiquinone oxidoreductase subunit C